jgi:hypothetical protein
MPALWQPARRAFAGSAIAANAVVRAQPSIRAGLQTLRPLPEWTTSRSWRIVAVGCSSPRLQK